MVLFRFLLATLFIIVFVYACLVGANHGWDILPVFLGDIVAMTWPGQFNLDFSSYLILSGIWLSWRHNFSVLGLFLGLTAALCGILFLSPYLLVASFQTNGNIDALLIGVKRAGTLQIRKN